MSTAGLTFWGIFKHLFSPFKSLRPDPMPEDFKKMCTDEDGVQALHYVGYYGHIPVYWAPMMPECAAGITFARLSEVEKRRGGPHVSFLGIALGIDYIGLKPDERAFVMDHEAGHFRLGHLRKKILHVHKMGLERESFEQHLQCELEADDWAARRVGYEVAARCLSKLKSKMHLNQTEHAFLRVRIRRLERALEAADGQ